MSDTGSDYTEQTGMVSELTLEREVRRERPAAQAAAATNAEHVAAADLTAPTPPRAAGVTHEYRGGVEESKEIPEEEEEEEDLVGDEDDEIESNISQRQQGGTGHKSTTDALASASASPDEQSTTTASSAGTGPGGGKSSVQREKIRVAALKARRASSRAVQSVVTYERDHQLVQTTWAGIRQGVRYASRKVRECTSVDTTATPSGDDGK